MGNGIHFFVLSTIYDVMEAWIHHPGFFSSFDQYWSVVDWNLQYLRIRSQFHRLLGWRLYGSHLALVSCSRQRFWRGSTFFLKPFAGWYLRARSVVHTLQQSLCFLKLVPYLQYSTSSWAKTHGAWGHRREASPCWLEWSGHLFGQLCYNLTFTCHNQFLGRQVCLSQQLSFANHQWTARSSFLKI